MASTRHKIDNQNPKVKLLLAVIKECLTERDVSKVPQYFTEDIVMVLNRT